VVQDGAAEDGAEGDEDLVPGEELVGEADPASDPIATEVVEGNGLEPAPEAAEPDGGLDPAEVSAGGEAEDPAS
jgi:hypothetical protein